jgi:hypothetical protein
MPAAPRLSLRRELPFSDEHKFCLAFLVAWIDKLLSTQLEMQGKTYVRPRKADHAAAIEVAQRAFWRNDCAGTSTRQIEECAGVTLPTLQTSYGGRRAFFLETLDAQEKARVLVSLLFALSVAIQTRTSDVVAHSYTSATATMIRECRS